MNTTEYTLQIKVTVPATEGGDFPTPEAVTNAVNSALDEGAPRINDWGDWEVGEAVIIR